MNNYSDLPPAIARLLRALGLQPAPTQPIKVWIYPRPCPCRLLVISTFPTSKRKTR